MPNIKSAKKRVRVIEKKTLINMAHKTALETAIKKFRSEEHTSELQSPC